jgi:hypothetical protein
MDSGSRLALGIAALVFVGSTVACDRGSDSVSPQSPLSIAGSWTLQEAVTNAQLSSRCTGNQGVSVTQNGTVFSGTFVSGVWGCTLATRSSQTSGGLPAVSGQIDGTVISFRFDAPGLSVGLIDSASCSYTGTITGNPATLASGNESCIIATAGVNYTYSGTWQLTR